ncbi:oxygen-independent coproporphyrinogen III oxidase [uncultured Bacteroides sp.]|uniref:oxygen-independent coproporphyrinogen III oxidase n=1 Tax=uncultured Bacteroides sp. TaxID=162156 RepID=UPI002AAB87B5|nr:oxygen-independent coproporphyrinogen III oxidase [uncultured Bacteroides sp.]
MNEDLIAKYNVPTPRYTSYPPANYFHDQFTNEDFEKAVIASNETQPQNLSFYIHIPFCRHLCHYCGCNSYPMVKDEVIAAYIDALKKEIMKVLPLLDKNRKISQIHYGGGSPSSIPLHYLKEINELLLSQFSCTDAPEIAIECHPGYLDENNWMELIKAGFNRCSIGVQDFNEKVLKGVNRRPSLLNMETIFGLLRAHGVSINLDFIYGLPYQTVQSFEETLQKAASLKPDRLVTFSYAHVPWVNKAMLILEKNGLPSPQEKSSMYDAAKRILTSNGYQPVGLDHFVLPDDDLNKALQSGQLHRNFQGYCTRKTTGQVYAFGVTAISQLSMAYSQNTKNIPEYIQKMNDGEFSIIKGYTLNREEQIAKEVITTLMCNNRLNWKELSSHIGVDEADIKHAISYSEDSLAEFAKDGIITYSPEEIKITPEGFLFVRNVAASFDPLMKGNTKLYSKPV